MLYYSFGGKIYSHFENGCRKNVHATIPKSNMGYDQYAVPDIVVVESSIVAFFTSLAILQISLKNSKLKTTHNNFPECLVHVFRQPFSK